MVNEKKSIKMPAPNTGSSLEKILADVSKQSATKQILIGAASGWVTGFASAKVGRLAAFTIGGAIILLEVANEQGIIKIDWSRLYRKVDEAGDKVQKTITGEGPKWVEKAERFVDRKIDQAENAIKKGQKKANKWYTTLIGDETGPKITNFHIFLVGFTGGVAVGLACA